MPRLEVLFIQFDGSRKEDSWEKCTWPSIASKNIYWKSLWGSAIGATHHFITWCSWHWKDVTVIGMPKLKGLGFCDPSEKCCSKLFQSRETLFFQSPVLTLAVCPKLNDSLSYILFKEIDQLDLSILIEWKFHNQVVYSHKEMNSSFVQLEALNVSKCVGVFRALSVVKYTIFVI